MYRTDFEHGEVGDVENCREEQRQVSCLSIHETWSDDSVEHHATPVDNHEIQKVRQLIFREIQQRVTIFKNKCVIKFSTQSYLSYLFFFPNVDPYFCGVFIFIFIYIFILLFIFKFRSRMELSISRSQTLNTLRFGEKRAEGSCAAPSIP
jgi:hypothetical protein